MAENVATIAGGGGETAVAADVFAAAPTPAGGATAPAGAGASDKGAPAPAAAADGAKPAPAAFPAGGVSPFPDDWREQLAGGDDKALSTLKRYGSPRGLWDKIRNQEKALSSRGPARPGKDATPEEVAAWRKAEGIPEKADGYVEALTLPDNAVLGDDDKPVVASYAAAMHEVGVPQAVVDKTMAWYFSETERMQTALAERDREFFAESNAALRNEFGADYRRNVNAIGTLFVGHEDVRDALLSGRTGDGRLIGDDPRIVRFLSQLALEVNPEATLLPTAAGTPGPSIEGRLKEIEGIMRGPDANEKYWKNPDIQNEYRQLIERQQKLQARGKAA